MTTRTISFAQAKKDLVKLLGNAAHGDVIEVTSFGEVAGILISPTRYQELLDIEQQAND